MTIPRANICIVAALSAERRAIGKKGQLLWHIPADLKRFKELTLGHPVIMGRKTFESIVSYLGKPLPNRTNLVVTRDPTYRYEGIEVYGSLEAAIARAYELDRNEIHIGGGAEIYAQALPFTSKLFLTLVQDEPEADSFFPEFHNDFNVIGTRPPQTHQGLTYQFVDLVRKE